MQNQLIKKMVIVGGGTAGWMTAALLGKLLMGKIQIEIVESDEIGIIGVGEATIPAIKIYNQLLGLNEVEMMKATQGTFKLGIEFVDWREKNTTYIHGFGKVGTDLLWMRTYQFWSKLKEKAKLKDLDNYSLGVVAARMNKFAMPNGQDLNSPMADFDYAYQFDAALFGQYLRKIAQNYGVKRTEGKIIKVNVNPENGFIESLNLENGSSISGDLFVDCSGARGLLISQTLGSEFDSYSKYLLCDSAYAIGCTNANELTPYTRSTALESGWQWRIPLQHRIGNGHVFSSNYISNEKALDRLLNNLDGEILNEPKLVKFTPGKRKEVFKKNCVAIGLSSGFLEPLESTSIHLIQTAILRLISLFPSNKFSQTDIDEYNRQTEIEYEFIRDFIIAHYKVTNRSDTEFWKYCKNMEIPDSLSQRLNLFKSSGRFFQTDNELFKEESWVQVLLGQGLEINPDPMTNLIPDDDLVSYLKNIEYVILENAKSFIPHADFIKNYCKSDILN